MLESVLESSRNRKKKKKKAWERKSERELEIVRSEWTRKRKRRVDRDKWDTCVVEKKKNHMDVIKKYYHNIFTINFM